MASKPKIRVAVIYGGRSGEHEISLLSAASVIRNLDRERFEVVPIAIDKAGRWLAPHDLSLLKNVGRSMPVFQSEASQVVLPPNPSPAGNEVITTAGDSRSFKFDVIFPVMHGPLCEDGTIQGLFELADVPYVGSGVLASAVGMDKEMAKRLIRDAGLPIVPYIAVKAGQFPAATRTISARVEKELGFPCFVKPANMGSSVGVHKAKNAAELESSLADAFRYDSKVLIEKAIPAREIEVAVLENPEFGKPALASTVGEIVPKHEFYSYEAKYLDVDGADLLIPAKLSAQEAKKVQALACDIFAALDCEGLARVDLFMNRDSGELYFNEVNTLPGFTQISMYPKLWEASGVGYSELLTRLIDLALKRHERKRKLSREYLPE